MPARLTPGGPARLRLNVFTPLPPLRTEIANHSAGFLPELAARAEVVAWTAQPEWDVADAPGLAVRRFDPADPPWAALNDADATFYNFGNNAAFHREIFEVAQRMPGVAVLHDLHLQHFFGAMAGSAAGAAAYLALMRRHHGPEGAADAQRFLAGKLTVDAMSERYPLSLGVAARATAIVAHNPAGVAALRAQTRLPVFHIPLSLRSDGVPEPARQPAAPPYRLVVFGFLGSNRRLGSILQALAAPQARGLFRLDIVGQVHDVAGTEASIAQLGLSGAVTQHGYVSEAALTRTLEAAHLAINLRYPSMGEASASQLRIWAHGLPSVVSRTGWYAGLPPDAVFHVDPAAEVQGLLGHLAAFHADQQPFLAAGRRGRTLVRAEHAPSRYADALLAIAADAPALLAGRTALDLAQTAADRLGMLDGPTLAAVAPDIARRVAGLWGFQD